MVTVINSIYRMLLQRLSDVTRRHSKRCQLELEKKKYLA